MDFSKSQGKERPVEEKLLTRKSKEDRAKQCFENVKSNESNDVLLNSLNKWNVKLLLIH